MHIIVDFNVLSIPKIYNKELSSLLTVHTSSLAHIAYATSYNALNGF